MWAPSDPRSRRRLSGERVLGAPGEHSCSKTRVHAVQSSAQKPVGAALDRDCASHSCSLPTNTIGRGGRPLVGVPERAAACARCHRLISAIGPRSRGPARCVLTLGTPAGTLDALRAKSQDADGRVHPEWPVPHLHRVLASLECRQSRALIAVPSEEDRTTASRASAPKQAKGKAPSAAARHRQLGTRLSPLLPRSPKATRARHYRESSRT